MTIKARYIGDVGAPRDNPETVRAFGTEFQIGEWTGVDKAWEAKIGGLWALQGKGGEGVHASRLFFPQAYDMLGRTLVRGQTKGFWGHGEKGQRAQAATAATGSASLSVSHERSGPLMP